MSKRSTFAVLVVLALLASIVSTASAQSPTAPAADKVAFTIGTVTDMVSPNPFKGTGLSEWETWFLNYDFLLNFSTETLEATDGLAYFPPDVSADGKTWTFKIRTGVTWSDGVPLTAKDIAFTYNFILDNNLGSFMPYLGDPAGFSAPDDTTFVWKMKTPSTAPLSPPDIPIVPEHVWSKYDGKGVVAIKEVPNSPIVGSGPFHMTKWEPGQFWTMEANPTYWNGAPHVDQIDIRIYDNPEALKLGLMNGEIDAAENLTPSIFQALENEPNITTNEGPGTVWDSLAFNFEGSADPSLRNLDVRRAIEASIDKEALVDRVALGYGDVGTSVIPATFAQWAWQPPESEIRGYDPEAAKALLDDAGYKDTNKDGLRETPDGQPWSLQVLAISDWPTSVPEAKLIVGWMNAVGIDTSIKVVSQSRGYDLWGAQDFDMYAWGWSGDPDPNFMLSVFTTDQCGSWSDGCYSNPKYDALFKRQTSTSDLAERQALVDQMQQILYEDVPAIVLIWPNDLQAYRNDLFTGFVSQPQPRGFLFYSWGSTSERSVRPVTADTASGKASSGGIPTWVWIALAAIVLVLIVALIMRRGKSAADTE